MKSVRLTWIPVSYKEVKILDVINSFAADNGRLFQPAIYITMHVVTRKHFLEICRLFYSYEILSKASFFTDVKSVYHEQMTMHRIELQDDSSTFNLSLSDYIRELSTSSDPMWIMEDWRINVRFMETYLPLIRSVSFLDWH